MTSQLMTSLSNTTNSEKYEQNKVMITQLVVGCLLDYKYLKENYRLMTADLSKQKALDADSRAIQQINFTGKIKADLATNNQKKHPYNFVKEQQKYWNYI